MTRYNHGLINAQWNTQTARSEYKKVWSALSTTEEQAKLHVIGVTEEAALQATGEETLSFLQDSVGIGNEDVVLEIGCGIGRVGKVVAPLCRKWIGCDVASNMLSLAAKRLKDLSNVELVEISGYNLSGIADASVDVVYCTVVFMQDYDLWLRIARAKLEVTFLPNVLCLYRHHEKAMSNTTILFEGELVRHLLEKYRSLVEVYSPKRRILGVSWSQLEALKITPQDREQDDTSHGHSLRSSVGPAQISAC